jgi:hypothetical protein
LVDGVVKILNAFRVIYLLFGVFAVLFDVLLPACCSGILNMKVR